jgi:hypothetical protein
VRDDGGCQVADAKAKRAKADDNDGLQQLTHRFETAVK